MVKIVALFGSTTDSEQFLQALHQANFENIDLRVIERAGKGDTKAAPPASPYPGPVLTTPGATSSGMPGPLPPGFEEGLAGVGFGATEKELFIERVRQGGSLVIIESAAEQVAPITAMVAQYNGRISSQEE